jgi:microcin C transport system permease protein
MSIVEKNGLFMIEGLDEPFNGRAYTSFTHKTSQKRQEFIFRRGIKNGEMRGWDEKNVPIEKGRYDNGQLVNYTEFQPGSVAQASAQGGTMLKTLLYPPNPPSLATRHFLGTNSSGIDVLAVLFGGWQQMLLAALLFIVLIFAIGVTIGGVLGYFGSWIDLIGQRLLEIWSVLPFLFIVIIINSLITPTFATVVIVLAIFGWVGTAEFFRTATYKERERDYVAAARLQGASTPRIIFRHVLPNVIAILITLAPFQIVGVISSISALDFLGFGLPPDLPSWGRLLQEGTDNFNAPWIVGSAFVAMVAVLLLFTFIGEAIREAFDPKKFTRYE